MPTVACDGSPAQARARGLLHSAQGVVSGLLSAHHPLWAGGPPLLLLPIPAKQGPRPHTRGRSPGLCEGDECGEDPGEVTGPWVHVEGQCWAGYKGQGGGGWGTQAPRPWHLSAEGRFKEGPPVCIPPAGQLTPGSTACPPSPKRQPVPRHRCPDPAPGASA